jgi:ABC-2 type transport system ATP-binding protein
MNNINSIIRTEGLSKKYASLKAVDNVSINVSKGEIYGFLGLNGAGKTTTIRMLLGMIKPSSGEAFINKQKVSAGNVSLWKDVGYLVEVPYSYPDLTVKENLDVIRRLRLINDPSCVSAIIEKLNLGAYSNVLAKNLSLGNSQRLGLAKAMIHKPSLLILDEPANGLDPAGIVEIRELLSDLALNKGVTVFISSHILGEISKFATRIGIIHQGLILYESSVSEMESLRKIRLQLKTRDLVLTRDLLSSKGFPSVITEEGILELFSNEAINDPSLVSALLATEGLPPSLLKVEEEDLESFFLRMISMKGGER